MSEGTVTAAVLDVLAGIPRVWFTMREIVDQLTERGQAPKLGAVAAALANLEPAGKIEVDRARRPLRYRSRS